MSVITVMGEPKGNVQHQAGENWGEKKHLGSVDHKFNIQLHSLVLEPSVLSFSISDMEENVLNA